MAERLRFNSRHGNQLKITVFADLHVSWRPSEYVDVPNVVLTPNERLKLILDQARDWGADVVVNLGDFCNSFDRDYERDALQMWKSFHSDKISVFGNHDGENDETSREAYLEKMAMPGAHYYRDYPDGWRFIVLDSGSPAGVPGAEQLEWFENAVETAGGKCLVAIHSISRETETLNNSIERANKKAGFCKVAACLSGHYHYPTYNIDGEGTHYIEINSASYRWISEPPEQMGPKFYMTVPFANLTLGSEGICNIRGFGERNQWAADYWPDRTGWEPEDALTYQAL